MRFLVVNVVWWVFEELVNRLLDVMFVFLVSGAAML
jgi:hypothetical protein